MSVLARTEKKVHFIADHRVCTSTGYMQQYFLVWRKRSSILQPQGWTTGYVPPQSSPLPHPLTRAQFGHDNKREGKESCHAFMYVSSCPIDFTNVTQSILLLIVIQKSRMILLFEFKLLIIVSVF